MAMMDKTTKKYINDELDKNDFQRMKESLLKERLRIESRIAELKVTENGFQEYCRYGFTLLGNMDEYFSAANVENKQKMIGFIFPEKLMFSQNTFQTITPNEILTLLCSTGKGLGSSTKEKSSKNAAQSCKVTQSIQFSNHFLKDLQRLARIVA